MEIPLQEITRIEKPLSDITLTNSTITQGLILTTQELKLSDVPPELQVLYNQLYNKIELLVSGGPIVDITKDPTVLRLIIQSVMVCVENFKDVNGQGWSGSEKKRITIVLTKFIINDLAVKGKIDPVLAQQLIGDIEFYGGAAIDLAVSLGKTLYKKEQEFAQDAQEKGCSAACKKDCCCIIC